MEQSLLKPQKSPPVTCLRQTEPHLQILPNHFHQLFRSVHKHEPIEAILVQTTILSASIYSNDVLFGAIIVLLLL